MDDAGYDTLTAQPTSMSKAGTASASVTAPSLDRAALGLMTLKMNPSMKHREIMDGVSGCMKGMSGADVMEGNWACYGMFHSRGDHCEFMTSLRVVGNSPVLMFQRMYGSGFVMDGLYSSAIQKIAKDEPKILGEKVETEAEEDFDIPYSDDEDSGKDDDQDQLSGYLQLSFDESIVGTWVAKTKTRHIEDQNHMMGLMAYNAENPENLKIISRNGGKELRELIQKFYFETENAALIWNSTQLAMHLTREKDCDKYGYTSKEFLENSFAALVYWHPGNKQRKENSSLTHEVTESRLSTNNLIHIFSNLKKLKVTDESFVEAAVAEGSGLDTEGIATILTYLDKLNSSTEVSSDEVGFLRKILQSAKKQLSSDD